MRLRCSGWRNPAPRRSNSGSAPLLHLAPCLLHNTWCRSIIIICAVLLLHRLIATPRLAWSGSCWLCWLWCCCRAHHRRRGGGTGELGHDGAAAMDVISPRTATAIKRVIRLFSEVEQFLCLAPIHSTSAQSRLPASLGSGGGEFERAVPETPAETPSIAVPAITPQLGLSARARKHEQLVPASSPSH